MGYKFRKFHRAQQRLQAKNNYGETEEVHVKRLLMFLCCLYRKSTKTGSKKGGGGGGGGGKESSASSVSSNGSKGWEKYTKVRKAVKSKSSDHDRPEKSNFNNNRQAAANLSRNKTSQCFVEELKMKSALFFFLPKSHFSIFGKGSMNGDRDDRQPKSLGFVSKANGGPIYPGAAAASYSANNRYGHSPILRSFHN